jgi:ATP-binding cassette, subfamily C, bacterial LapB
MSNTPEEQTLEWTHAGVASMPPHDPLLACLLNVGRLYQKPLSAQVICAGLPLVKNRLTPDLLIRAASKVGFSAKIIKTELMDINDVSLPAILFLKNQKACVLERIDNLGKAHLIQSESGGDKAMPVEELNEIFTGYAVFIQPVHRFDKRAEATIPLKQRHWFWGTMFDFVPVYTEVLVASLLINLFALASPLFVMNVYDRVVPNNATMTLAVLAIGVTIVFSFDFLLKLIRSYFLDHASKNIDVRLSSFIFERMLGIQMASRPDSVGTMANTVQSYESFRSFITSATMNVLVDLPFAIIFILVIMTLGGSLALVPIVAFPLVIIVGLLVHAPLSRYVKENYRYQAEKQATLIESLSGIETIKTTGAESPMQTKWERVVNQSAALGAKIHLLSSIGTNFSSFATQMSSIIVVLFGVFKISSGDMTTGALIACTILTGRAMAPVAQVAGLVMRYHEVKTSLENIDAVMAMPVERTPEKMPLERFEVNGAIELSKVDFNYPNQEVAALKDINLKIKPGERLGIIGRIGSGKTTLEKLIMGLYQPGEGQILLDGVETQQYDVSDLRKHIGYVPQDITLFYGTIRDNITIGAPYVDDATLMRAAQLSGVADFVNRHPEGFDWQVSERGDNLSGGQRQSIAIARALLLDPPILLLDEPTCLMDNKTENLFKKRLQTIMKDKTLILVTHRASLLTMVDRLVIVDSGKIIADGPREAILTALSAEEKRKK